MNFQEKLIELKEQKFTIKEGNIVGDKCYLIEGSFAEFDKNNLIYRSSIWNENGEPVSLSYKKFFNWTEKPNLVAEPTSLSRCSILEKVDGSTCIISKYKGQLIVRTRGTFDASAIENGYEIEVLKKKYPRVFDNIYLDRGYSIVCEWISSTNVIVIKYEDCPDIILTNIIKHSDYSYFNQKELDSAAVLMNIKRPKWFDVDKMTIDEMISIVKKLKGEEGFCVYFHDDQDIKKIKSEWYLVLHTFKSKINDLEHCVDLFIEYDQPSYGDFLKQIESNFDYECAEYVRPFVSKILDYQKEVHRIIDGMKKFCEGLSGMSRKDQAAKVMSSYGNTERSGMVFNVLDNKQLQKRDWKRLYFQVMKH